MRSDELKCMQVLDEKCTVSKWWMPLIWATNIIDQAREENRIRFEDNFLLLSNTIYRKESKAKKCIYWDLPTFQYEILERT